MTLLHTNEILDIANITYSYGLSQKLYERLRYFNLNP